MLLNALTRDNSSSYQNSVTSSPRQLSVGVSTSIRGKESMLQLGMEAETNIVSDWLSGRFGASMFNSDLLYAGAALGTRASILRWKLSHYSGLEGYVGDHKSCETGYEDGEVIETCEKTFLATLYSELGLKWNFSRHGKIYVFTRGYSKVDQTARRNLTMFYGASLFFGNL